MDASWTEERIETLRRLVDEGLTSSQIAMELGGVTRNAVIGKLHRLQIKLKTAWGNNRGDKPRRVRKMRQDRVARFVHRQVNGHGYRSHAFPSDDEHPGSLELSFMDLGDGHCRWPHGDGQYTFCGRPQLNGYSYCAHHERLATRRVDEL